MGNIQNIQNIKKAKADKELEPLKLEMARRDLLYFGRNIFKKEYKIEFLESWYHRLLCDALMRVESGDITKLIINMPPSYGKTEFAVRLFVSWFLGKNPKKNAIYTTYSDDLAGKTPREIKGIIKCPEYKKTFPNIKLGDKTSDKEWNLAGHKGGMYSTTVGGPITGFHGNVIIIDDPMKAIEANSKSVRDFVVDYYQSSILSRLKKNDKNAAIIIIMQRLHEDDLVGYLTNPEKNELYHEWEQICLTGIEDEKKIYSFYDFYYEREANEPLNPLFENVEALEKQKMSMHEKWSSQYMQNPQEIETGYVKDEHFTYVSSWEIEEDKKYIIVDPAQSTKETSDNRAIGTIGVSLNVEKIELFNVYSMLYGKWTMDVTCDNIIEVMIANVDANVYIENGGGGILIEQRLKQKVAQTNALRKQKGKPALVNRIIVYTTQTKISKNQKIDAGVECLKNGQIRFLRNAPGTQQIKKEYKAFHPEKDSKEDDCIDVIGSAVVNEWCKPKIATKIKKPSIPKKCEGKWRI